MLKRHATDGPAPIACPNGAYTTAQVGAPTARRLHCDVGRCELRGWARHRHETPESGVTWSRLRATWLSKENRLARQAETCPVPVRWHNQRDPR